jgi:hypothetical protein
VAETVNGLNDSNASIAGLLKWAEGSFPSETGGSESDNNGNATNPGTNSYSLQMNTSLFPSPACSTSTSSGCRGWEQLIYDPQQEQIYFEFSLVNYGGSCPQPFGSNYFAGSNNSIQVCYFNSSPYPVPAVAAPQLGAGLTSTSMAGSTNATTDAITLTVSGKAYTLTQPSVLGLAGGWNDVEFNIYGENNSTQATFNTPTTLEVQVLTETLVPSTTPPNCPSSPTTGWGTVESNTLSLIGSCCNFGGAEETGIQFLESNVASTPAQACPTLASFSNPLTVPQGDFATTWTILDGALVGPVPNAALQPTTCTVTPSALSVQTFTGAGGQKEFTFGAPIGLAVGTPLQIPITCDTGSFTQNIVVGPPSPLNTAQLSAGNDPLEVVQGSEGSANIVLSGPWQTSDKGANATVQVTSNPIPYGSLQFASGGPIDGDGIIEMTVTTTASTPLATYTVGLLIKDLASGVEIATNVQVEVICLPEDSTDVCVANSSGSPMCGNHAAGCGTVIDCGTCPGGAACGANGYCPCVPTFTSCSSTETCGSLVNNCGQTIECGTCSGSTTCSNNMCCPSGEVNSNGVCCPSGEVGGDGICCPSGDVVSVGHCCPSGDIWSGTACIVPIKGGGGGGGCRCTKTECTCE